MKSNYLLSALLCFSMFNLYPSDYNFEQEVNLLKDGCLMDFDDGSKIIGTIQLSYKNAITEKLDILLQCYIFQENDDTLTATFSITPYFEIVDIESYEKEMIAFLLQRKDLIARMLKQVENECTKLSINKIYTFVINQGDIVSLYQKQGFFESSFDKLYRLSYVRKLYWLLTDESMLTNPDSIKLQKSI